MKHVTRIARACLVLLVSAGAARADSTGLQRQSELMFNSLLNYTSPTAHLGQRRGFIDGGSLVVLNRIMN
jgi:conjugative transfer pilus assembly protein TraH